jgi:glycine/D-amino acid oxidase-like deaminating enzyme
MKHVDYIIVGCGLAGIAFCEQLRAAQKSFIVFDDQSQQSSVVAAGLYNPVILKRFTEVWKAKEQLALAIPFYQKLEQEFNVQLDYQLPVYRRFASVEEQNEWFAASDKPSLQSFLSTELIKNTNPSISAPFGFGKVNQTGRVDTALLLIHYKDYLKENQQYLNETFDYDELKVSVSEIVYKNSTAKHIIFAEGFGMVHNPYFKELPLNVAKGEVLTIKAPNLSINFVLKSSIFIIPLGNNFYNVGATYDWKDKTHNISSEAKDELVDKLNQVIQCDFEVVNQVAGIRPTVKDRRPLVGVHPEHQNIAILNGLGTRGVMLAPFLAKQLFEHIENGKPLDTEIDIKRF